MNSNIYYYIINSKNISYKFFSMKNIDIYIYSTSIKHQK